MTMTPRRLTLIMSLIGTAGLAACSDAPEHVFVRDIAGADPEQGRHLIHTYGCGTCHTIEGIRGARGKVGPVLDDYARQHLLAGFLPNTPPYLIAWLMDPVALNPQTGMPAQGVSEEEARHMASYLYTLGEQARIYPSEPRLPLRGQEEVMTGFDDPVAERTETTPRTHRIAPLQPGRAPPPS
jgi:cytochrome c2